MSLVFMYAGQGSQRVLMGMDIYEEFEEYRRVFDESKLPDEYKNLIKEGPEELLKKTEYTQPCMAVFAAGVTNCLKKYNIIPDAALGLSLGEYGALYCAGVINENDYIDITRFRGSEMAKAAEGHECLMSAAIGCDAGKVINACREAESEGFITVANYNCPGQYVMCGDEAAIIRAEQILKESGVRKCVRLNVSGPFHTRYMEPASMALKEYFKHITFYKPQIPVVMNVTGDYLERSGEVKELLIKQVKSSVRFEDSVKRLIEDGADKFIEIGPGNVLSGFVKKTAKAMDREVKVYKIDTADDLRYVIENREEIING